MKVKSYELKSLEAIIGVFLLALGLFTGYWATSSEMSEKIAIIEADKQIIYDQKMECESALEQAYKEIDLMKENLAEQQEDNELLHQELDEANLTILALKSEEYKLVYIGDYKLTHYCTEKRAHICGTGAGITATGTQVAAGRTVAVDPSVIPYGTKMYIEGYGWRVAEDCGGSVNGGHIDIAVESHSQALSIGTTSGGVWVLVPNS